MITYKQIAERTQTQIPEHLVEDAEPPKLFWADQEPSHQGDVWIQPTNQTLVGKQILLTGVGHKVVAGEADRNSHILNGDGHFVEGRTNPDPTIGVLETRFDYGTLVVPEGGETVLTHTAEHGSTIIGPGVWRLWGQKDAATQQRAAD